MRFLAELSRRYGDVAAFRMGTRSAVLINHPELISRVLCNRSCTRSDESRKAMKQVLDEIRDGTFARRWIDESKGDAPEFGRLRAEGRAHQIEEVGARLRARMAWLNSGGK